MLFDRWRQRVLPRGHIGASWRIRLNLCILQPTRIHNRNGKWIGSAIFAQLTTESAYNLQLAALCTRISPSRADLDLPCNTMLWAHVSPQPKRHLNRFSRVCTDDHRVSLYLTTVCLFLPQIASSYAGIWTSCNTLFIGPTRVQNANGNLIISAISAGSLVWQTDRATDRPTDHATQCNAA